MAKRRRSDSQKYIRIIILMLAFAAILYAVWTSGVFNVSQKSLKVTALSCTPAQMPRAFGNNIIYNDGTSLNCISSDDKYLWGAQIGTNFDFHASSNYVAVWTKNTVRVFDKNGHESYTYSPEAERVLFARMGKKWMAYATETLDGYNIYVVNVKGDNMIPPVICKNFEHGSLLDMGFFEGRVRLWVTTLKTLHPVTSTFVYFFDEKYDKHDKGTPTSGAELGEELYYRVVNGNGKLNAVGTKEIKRFDESLSDSKVQNQNVLVYGWQCVDSFTDGGEAKLLFAPVYDESKANYLMSELRLIVGMNDYRYTLPEDCVGAVTDGSKIFAFSEKTVYHARIKDKRFNPIRLTLDEKITALLDRTDNGKAVLASDTKTYVVDLP